MALNFNNCKKEKFKLSVCFANMKRRRSRHEARAKLVEAKHTEVRFIEKRLVFRQVFFLAGAVGLEPTTNGFGDRDSTN